MKIGFDAKRFFHNKTGLGNYSRDLVRILATYFPENNYYLYNLKPKKIDRIAIDNKIIIEKLPSSEFYKKHYVLWRLLGIKKDIENANIDIYHGLSGEIPLFLNLKKTKTIVTIHDLIFMRYPEYYSFIDRKIHYLKFKYAARKADLVIAISEQTKADIIHFLNIEPEKIKVIYQGCAPVFKTEISDEFLINTQKKYDLPDEYLLNVGTIEKRKNIFSVIKAIKDTTISLVIVGKKTNYCIPILKYIKENNLESKIIFLENVALNELAAIYKSAKIFIYPSVFEGFGIPIVEALYSQVPVITNKIGCFPEAGGENSLYIDTENIAEINKNIVALWHNESQRQQMTQNGLKFVQKFNDDTIATNVLKTYTLVLGKE